MATRIAPQFIAIGTSNGAGDIKGGTAAAPSSTLDLAKLNAACENVRNPMVFKLWFTGQ